MDLHAAGALDAGITPERPTLPIARNTALLSAAQAFHSAMHQLAVAVASITLVRVLDVPGLLGLGPAVVHAAGALAAIPAGRSMDRFGRVPVLAAGRGVGVLSCGAAALGSALDSAPTVLVGMIGVGAANGANLLVRAAGADMYPPERRARGVGLVLFGAVFGAILGPAVFGPLVAGRNLDGDMLATLWLVAAGFELVGLALVTAVRPDPKEIATLLGHKRTELPAKAARLRAIFRRPGVLPALVAAQASVGVMVALMTLTGAVVVDHFHHHDQNIFPIIGVQVIGRYVLVIVEGDVVDQIGRIPSLSGGLILMGVSASGLLWGESVAATAAAGFGLGLGWSVSYVAATAEIGDRTEPWERGRMLAFTDLLSGACGAALTLLAGLALSALGVSALAIGGLVLTIVPSLWILRPRRALARPVSKAARPTASTEEGDDHEIRSVPPTLRRAS
jgi:MFS family permease